MPWIYVNKPHNQTVHDFFTQQFPQYTILKCCCPNQNVAYLAAQDKNGNVTAIVCELTYPQKTNLNFGYKALSEFSGPTLAKAPNEILDLLTPLPDTNNIHYQFAKKWRSNCRAVLSTS